MAEKNVKGIGKKSPDLENEVLRAAAAERQSEETGTDNPGEPTEKAPQEPDTDPEAEETGKGPAEQDEPAKSPENSESAEEEKRKVNITWMNVPPPGIEEEPEEGENFDPGAPVYPGDPADMDPVKLHEQRVKTYGSDYVVVTKGHLQNIFTAQGWKMLGKDKNGWQPATPVPPEVLKLRGRK